MLPTIEWRGDRVVMIDQRRLPGEEIYVECRDVESVAGAIETMIIRGAPAIGVAAAYGVALGALAVKDTGRTGIEIGAAIERLRRTRPTARNLFWALERMKAVFEAHRDLPPAALKERLVDEAREIEREDAAICESIGRAGAELIRTATRC
jgi:methylthioribose-1-phosphate isomerase